MTWPILALALLVFTAGAEAVPPTHSKPVPLAPTATKVPASWDWAFFNNEGYGELDFGNGQPQAGENGGKYVLGLQCPPGEKRMAITDVAAARVTLAAGGHTQSYNVGALIPANNLVLKAFRGSGGLSIIDRRNITRLVASPAGKKAVERFFKFCSGHAG